MDSQKFETVVVLIENKYRFIYQTFGKHKKIGNYSMTSLHITCIKQIDVNLGLKIDCLQMQQMCLFIGNQELVVPLV